MKAYRLATVLGALAAVAWAGAALAAEIVYLEGNVQVQSGAGQEWQKAENGMTVNIGDSIRTARHSKAEIALDAAKKNKINLGEKTLVVLNSATADTIDRLDLAKGRVYSKLEGLKEGLSFEVTTPSAVAGVRGSFFMVYTERETDEVSAYEDTVYLRTFDADHNLISETMLPEGFKTFVERFDLPSTFQQIGRAEFVQSDRLQEHLSARMEGREPEHDQGPQQQEGPQGPEQTLEQASEQNLLNTETLETKDQQQDKKTEERLEDFTEPSSQEEPYVPEEYGY